MREQNEKLKNQYYKMGGNIEENWMERLMIYLKGRHRAKVNVKRIATYYIEKILCFAMGKCSRRRKLSISDKQYNLFKNGETKILQELDTVNLILRLRQMEFLISQFLNDALK